MASSVKQSIWLACLLALLSAEPSKCSSPGDVDLPEWGSSSEITREDTNRNLEVCECSVLSSNYTCTCTAPSGIISTPADAISIVNTVNITYYIESDEESMVAVYFQKKDVPEVSSVCNFQIGSKFYDDKNKLDEDNVPVMSSSTPLIVNGYFPYCTYNFKYQVYSPNIINETITSSSGFLVAPTDEIGHFHYRPNTQMIWIFMPEDGASKFNFTFNELDLGAPNNIIHGADKVNQSEGDFLLIGPGPDIMGGSDLMYYGRREANLLRQVVTLGPYSHVFFYSSNNIFNATGFNISYEAIPIEETTTVPSTTMLPIPPEKLETSTMTQINGVLNPNENYTIGGIISEFKIMVANVSNVYLRTKNLTQEVEIEPRMVEVTETKRCNPYECIYETCVAFNFSISALYPNGSWIFTKTHLDMMMNSPDTETYLKNLDEDCAICDKPSRNMWMYVGLPVAVVIVGCLASMAVWYLSTKDHRDDSRLKYEQEMKDRTDDNRRRSSADASILGLGGSIASRGSHNSRRFTMPFPKPKNDVLEEEEYDIDTSGYKEYDPDQGPVDPSEFGIHREFLNDKSAVRHYSNAAFVDDEDDDTPIFRRDMRQQEDTVAAGTDSDDSDGGAVSFAGRKKNAFATPITATAEIHIMPDTLSLKRMSDCGETAL